MRFSVLLLFLISGFRFENNVLAEVGETIPAETGSREEGLGGELGRFLELNRELPKAVCDEQVASRAPTLGSFSDSTDLAEGRDLSPRFELNLEVDEAKVISFLMGDRSTFLSDPRVETSFGSLETATDRLRALGVLKRELSIEICRSIVSPGGVKDLLSRRPGVFLPVKPVQKNHSKRRSATGLTLELVDIDRRFGKLNDQWWVAGWLEPYEVRSVRLGDREYRRLAHPVTNETRYVEVLTKTGTPLGYFFPSKERTAQNLKSLLGQEETQAQKKSKVETYRLLMESAAFQKLRDRPKRVQEIRNLQEFYQSLMKAYQIYPQDARFDSYGKKSRSIANASLGKVLDKSFFDSLSRARINGVSVDLSFFAPDRKLHAIYEEFQQRLAGI